MSGSMLLTIFDVEHGACAMLEHTESTKLTMIDSGHNSNKPWHPSTYIKNVLQKNEVDYLIVTNADHDHMSDLNGLWEAKISVKSLTRNRKVTPAELRALKLKDAQNGKLSDDIERFLKINEEYTHPMTEPFNDHMGGVQLKTFSNRYSDLLKPNTNDLSLVCILSFAGFKIMFPGDLERAGWLKLLELQDFRDELSEVSVLVASHHGRESGYCEEVFDHCSPQCVVFSDKPIEHETQKGMTDVYAATLIGDGINTANGTKRKVLTTRSDGWIQFIVEDQNWSVTLEAEKNG